MRQLRATVRADPQHAPSLFTLLAHSPEVDEARIVEMFTTADGVETFLVAVDGDVDSFADRAAEHEAVDSVEVSRFDEGQPYVLLVLRPLEPPVVEVDRCDVPRPGFVVQRPIIYRDGTMSARVIGDPAGLQQTLGQPPDGMTVTLEEIGEFRGGLDSPRALLSDRQREALEAANELGYYEQPRRATHEDVAVELDCAPQTASDHLQKAEAKVIDAVLDEFASFART